MSETDEFTDFNNKDALIWLEEELLYGDWTSGLEGDGSYGKQMQIPISTVTIVFILNAYNINQRKTVQRYIL